MWVVFVASKRLGDESDDRAGAPQSALSPAAAGALGAVAALRGGGTWGARTGLLLNSLIIVLVINSFIDDVSAFGNIL